MRTGSKCSLCKICRNYQPLPDDSCVEHPRFCGNKQKPMLKIKIDFYNVNLNEKDKRFINRNVNDVIAAQINGGLTDELLEKMVNRPPKCFEQKNEKTIYRDSALTQPRLIKPRHGVITKFFNGRNFITGLLFNEPASRFELERNIINKHRSEHKNVEEV